MLACFSSAHPFFRSLGLNSLLLCLLLAGCHGEQKTETGEEASSSSTARQLLEKQRLCADNFAKIYQILSPSPENIDTELQSAQDILNQWLTSCAEWSEAKIEPSAPWFQSLSDQKNLASLNDRTASQLDILYLRDQLLMRGMLEQIIAEIPEDSEKIRTLFEYVVRNVASDDLLINPRLRLPFFLDQQTLDTLGPRSIPRSLQELILTGRGTAEDRTWLFVSLLQQMGLNALLVSPAAAEGQPAPPALMVVPLEQQILFFSPAWGIEIAKKDSPWTLADFSMGWESLLNAITLPEDQQSLLAPLKQANWKQARLQLPYSPLLVSPRMQTLQQEFMGDYVCEVYQPLQTPAGEAETVGLISGLQSTLAPLFEKFEPVFWDYPHQMYSRVVDNDELTDRLRQLYLLALFKDVQSLRTSEDQNEQKIVTASLEKRMLMARIDQLLGKQSQAISTYMKLRLQSGVAGQGDLVALENLLRSVQAEDAHYWSALAQFEIGDYRSATSTLQNYLNRYQQGYWTAAGRELLIQAYLQQGEKAKALETLQQTPWTEGDRVRQLQWIQQLQEPAAEN